MDTNAIIVILIFCFYILPLKTCIDCIITYYSEGNQGENEKMTTLDFFVALIPLLNIYAIAKSMVNEIKYKEYKEYKLMKETFFGGSPKKDKKGINMKSIKFDFKIKNNDNN